MSKRILLVDDDPFVQDLAKYYLKDAGYIVRSCRDGFRAMAELQGGSYNLVILDISMPHMDGFDTLKSIRNNATTKDIPVLMLTSHNDRDDVLRTAQYQISGYILKPLTREDFIKRVLKALS